MDVLRTRTLPRSLMETAAQEGVVFVGDDNGGYVFPGFQPAFDGMFAIVRLMEMLSAEGRSLSDILREIPPTVMVKKKIPCAWERKGALMRMLAEHAKGKPSRITSYNVCYTKLLRAFRAKGTARIVADYPSARV